MVARDALFVLDNSVTMRWLFDGSQNAKADAVLHSLISSIKAAVVPLLWRYEVSSVLARAQIKQTISSRDAADFMEGLQALPIHVDIESGEHIFSNVHQAAVTYRLTSYDAAYLELAQRHNLPLATFDAELIAACKKSGVRLLF